MGVLFLERCVFFIFILFLCYDFQYLVRALGRSKFKILSNFQKRLEKPEKIRKIENVYTNTIIPKLTLVFGVTLKQMTVDTLNFN